MQISKPCRHAQYWLYLAYLSSLVWCNVVQERSIEGVGDGMVEGGAALGMGIYRGFTGLVTKPVEGAKSKGVGGPVQCTAACLACLWPAIESLQKPWPKH